MVFVGSAPGLRGIRPGTVAACRAKLTLRQIWARDICNLAILVVGFRSFAIMEIGFALLPFSTKGAPLQCLV
jgi:hypothetical protein